MQFQVIIISLVLKEWATASIGEKRLCNYPSVFDSIILGYVYTM